MIDENFKVFLIEANTNPCLEICSPLLARIIPELLDNSFRIAIDPLYQPSQFLAKLKDTGDSNNATSSMPESRPSDTQRDAIELPTASKKDAMGEGDFSMSPSKQRGKHKKEEKTEKESEAQNKEKDGEKGDKAGNRGRQRLELLTQIKYTLIYDERIDKPVVDKILADYEKKMRQE